MEAEGLAKLAERRAEKKPKIEARAEKRTADEKMRGGKKVKIEPDA